MRNRDNVWRHISGTKSDMCPARTEMIITYDDNEEQGNIIEDHFNTALIEFTGTD
jgi:hypothetical protein